MTSQAADQNVGHGHVFPRPDGMKARCGGPAICHVCAVDAARKRDDEMRSKLPAPKHCSHCEAGEPLTADGFHEIAPKRFYRCAKLPPYERSATPSSNERVDLLECLAQLAKHIRAGETLDRKNAASVVDDAIAALQVETTCAGCERLKAELLTVQGQLLDETAVARGRKACDCTPDGNGWMRPCPDRPDDRYCILVHQGCEHCPEPSGAEQRRMRAVKTGEDRG